MTESTRSANPPRRSPLRRRLLLALLGLGTAKLAREFFRSESNRQQFGRAWSPIARDALNRALAIVDWRRDDALQALNAPQNLPLPSELPLNWPRQSAPFDSISPPGFGSGTPVRYESTRLLGVPFHRLTVDLRSPQTLLTIAVANDAPYANSSRGSYGDEPFANMVDRAHAAAVCNGTFFGTDANKHVLGNLLAGGRVLKYSPWENYGTTLGITANRKLELITARAEGKPDWQDHWFSLTCGPRLLRDGEIYLAPHGEGFRDPSVLSAAYRCAIGYPKSGNELVLVNFAAPLSLERTADLMKAIGCYQAMNLDGGASQGLAYRGEIVVRPERNLTNAIVIYDTLSPAPSHLYEARRQFDRGLRPDLKA